MNCSEFQSHLAKFSFDWFSAEQDKIRSLLHSHMQGCPSCADSYRRKQENSQLKQMGYTGDSFEIMLRIQGIQLDLAIAKKNGAISDEEFKNEGATLFNTLEMAWKSKTIKERDYDNLRRWFSNEAIEKAKELSIKAQRKAAKKCTMCGKPLGLLQSFFTSEVRHKQCTQFTE